MWLLLALAGCPAVDDTGKAGDDTAETGDSGDTADTGESGGDTAETGETGDTEDSGDTGSSLVNPLAEEDLLGLWALAPAPAQLLQMVVQGLEAGDSIGCPTLREEGTKVVVEGGCTDDSGFTWSGSVWVDGASDAVHLEFDHFGMSVSTASYSATGDLLGSSVEGGLEVTGEFKLELTGYEAYGFPSPTTLRYSSVDQVITDVGRPLLLSGGMEEIGVGALVVSAEVSWDDSVCAKEPIGGEAIFDGARSVILRFDGDTDCDSCFPWTASDGDSGEICEA